LKQWIAEDDEIREKRSEEDAKKQEEEEEKLKEKQEMTDAARQIQRKWDWYQKIGRF
jgi:hypothetical protein